MSTIFIPVEIPDDELVNLLAKMTTSQPAQYAPNPGAAQTANQVPLPPEPQDPWADQGQAYPQGQPQTQQPPVAPSGQYPPQNQPPVQSYQGAPQAPQAQPQGQPAPNMPQCQHGVRKFVAAGFSQRTGQPYPAFWACQANRNDPTKCKSLPA